MTVHVEYDIRNGKLTLKTDGTVALITPHREAVLSALDACDVPYIYQELGHTPIYEKAMEWHNDPTPDKEEGYYGDD